MEQSIYKEDVYNTIPKKTINYILNNLKTDIDGIHGINHWMRVLANLVIIHDNLSIDLQVAIAFSFLHDAFRINDFDDIEHGERVEKWFKNNKKISKKINLTERQKEVLFFACSWHSQGKTISLFNEIKHNFNEFEINTIVSCWDADRLDLARAGILPNDRYLSTDVAKIKTIQMLCNKHAIGNKLYDFYEELKFDLNI